MENMNSKGTHRAPLGQVLLGFTLFVLVRHRSLTIRDNVTPLLTSCHLQSYSWCLTLLQCLHHSLALLCALPCVLPCALPRVSPCLFQGCCLSTLCTALSGTNSFACLLLSHFHGPSHLTGTYEGQVGGVKQTVSLSMNAVWLMHRPNNGIRANHLKEHWI